MRLLHGHWVSAGSRPWVRGCSLVFTNSTDKTRKCLYKINIYRIEYWKISPCHDLQKMLFYHPTLTTSKKILSYEEKKWSNHLFHYEMSTLAWHHSFTLSMSKLNESKKAQAALMRCEVWMLAALIVGSLARSNWYIATGQNHLEIPSTDQHIFMH